MYNDYINEKISEKIDYDISLFKEYLVIYLNLIIKYPFDKELRINLNKFIKDYYKYSKVEYELLKYIRKINNNLVDEDCTIILEELENIFLKQFNYNEDILNGYEEALFYDDKDRAIVYNRRFNNLDKDLKNNYIKKIEKKCK